MELEFTLILVTNLNQDKFLNIVDSKKLSTDNKNNLLICKLKQFC